MNNLLFKFASTKNSELAYLLHGEWGSGKTHFIKENFLPNVEAENKYYISLFGVSSIEQVYSQLITQKIIGKKSGKFLRLSTGVLSTMVRGLTNYVGEKTKLKASDIGVDIADIIPINDCVIVFDDLERISKKADESELFGEINTYFISESSIRVVFVADQEKIESEIFKQYKEKIIGFQSTLEIDIRQVLNSIASKNENEDFKNFLVSNIDFFYELIKYFGVYNLRTISYYFSILELVYRREISSMVSKNDFLYSIFVLAVEEKENRLSFITSIDDVPGYIIREKGNESINLTNENLEGHFNKYTVSGIRRKYGYSFNYYYYKSILNIRVVLR